MGHLRVLATYFSKEYNMKLLSSENLSRHFGGTIISWAYPVIPGLTDRLPVPLSPVLWPFSHEKTEEVVKKTPALQGLPPYTIHSFHIGRGS